MGNVIIQEEEMKNLKKYTSDAKKASKDIWEGIDKLRSLLAQMYEGQVSDESQDILNRLMSQYLMVEKSYKKLKDFVKSTEFMINANDENEKSRVENIDSAACGSGAESDSDTDG